LVLGGDVAYGVLFGIAGKGFVAGGEVMTGMEPKPLGLHRAWRLNV